MGRIIGIILVVALLGFGGYKIFASSVDRADPNAVGAAFLKALKKEDLSRAKKYVHKDLADAWHAKTKEQLSGMKSNGMAIFRESIPDEPTFATAQPPKGSTDKAMKAGGTTITLRDVAGEWYVTGCSVP